MTSLIIPARVTRLVLTCALVASLPSSTTLAQKPKLPPPDKLPQVPRGFEISVFAGEPLIYKPTSLCFDARGRALVGQGPQYHLSESISDTDSVVLLLDSDNDGVADGRKIFATGFNSIQGLAWKGNDLYVANAPELTVVRDLDGDDVADEYVVVYTDLGNHEHALHGLVWGPDGRLYMSKGNSKGHNQPEKYGRVAPRAFRELWDVAHPKGAADIPPLRTFTAKSYRKTYHDPHDDWGRQGGVLRCEPLGSGLEIVSRGMRNPWDIAIDSGFNLLGTDNDQTQGDRIIMPFFAAHFGWGHRYSSHWTGAGNLPTVPVSGPMTSGSWAGIAWYDHGQFPAAYRNAFFINDWMFGTYVYRPEWNGALLTAAEGRLEPFIRRRDGGMIYRPTDIACGPDGAIYTLGWGSNYHYEPGREGSWLFRVTHQEARSLRQPPPGRLETLSVPHLLAELGPGITPSRRVNAQDELVRRGSAGREMLLTAIRSGRLSRGQETWAVWAVGRMTDDAARQDSLFRQWALPPKGTRISRNLRIQALRILGFRAHRGGESQQLQALAKPILGDLDPRIRFEAMQAIHQAQLTKATPVILEQLARETDRIVFYAGWQALRALAPRAARRMLLNHSQSGVRLAALLGLQEDYELTQQDVLKLVDRENDARVQSWALTFAMAPEPPAKLSNNTLRIEMEQSWPIDRIIARAEQSDRPQLRRLYLQMIARASVREGAQQQQLLTFYRSLQDDQDRRLILPAAANTLDALPDLWAALGNDSLRDAAINGIANLHRRRVKQLNSDETAIRKTIPGLSSVNTFAAEIAGRILKELTEVAPQDPRVSAALRAVNELPLPRRWSIDNQALNQLVSILEQRKEPAVRRQTLRLIGKLDGSDMADNPRVQSAVRRLCRVPDAHLYRDLQAVTRQLKLEIPVPKPRAATINDVLGRLDQANSKTGQRLFFDRIAGAGCVSCHRVRGRGTNLGPDLSGVGIRLTPKNVVQAIVHPDAAITEGFAMQLFLDADGRTHVGAVVRETDAAVTLLQTDGSLRTIATETIESRKRLKQSVMPTGYALLGAEQLADLTAWLLTLRDASTTVPPQSSP